MIVLPSQRHAQIVRDRLMNGKAPSKPEMIEAPLPMIEEPEPSYRMEWQRGVDDILAKHDTTLAQATSLKRNKAWTEARYEIAQYLQNRRWSLERIGRFIKRDHSAVIYILSPEEKKDAKRTGARERSLKYAPARAAKAAWGNHPVLPIIDCTSVAVFSADGWIVAPPSEGDAASGKGEKA